MFINGKSNRSEGHSLPATRFLVLLVSNTCLTGLALSMAALMIATCHNMSRLYLA